MLCDKVVRTNAIQTSVAKHLDLTLRIILWQITDPLILGTLVETDSTMRYLKIALILVGTGCIYIFATHRIYRL